MVGNSAQWVYYTEYELGSKTPEEVKRLQDVKLSPLGITPTGRIEYGSLYPDRPPVYNTVYFVKQWFICKDRHPVTLEKLDEE